MGVSGVGSDACFFDRWRFVVVWLASSLASQLPQGGACWPLDHRTPDATKPALGGLRWCFNWSAGVS